MMFGHQDSKTNDAVAQAPSSDSVLSHPVAPQTVAPTAASAPQGNDGFILTEVAPTVTPAPVPEPPTTATIGSGQADPQADLVDSAPVADTGLLELKQAALQELTPLIDHLEQTAEEKFRTMMMMIQASDDQTLLSEAYHAAQSIEDKKARAQALLDVVNEINYFTQQHHDAA